MKTYRVAGEAILADVGDSILAELSIPSGSGTIVHFSDEETSLVFDGPGWVSGEWHNVRCVSTSSGFQVEIERIGNFRVVSDPSSFLLVDSSPDASQLLIDCAAVGPPLILALALRQIFCLHASAISHNGRVIAFAGASGAGKSTIARLLSEAFPETFSRCGDDVLPVHCVDDPQVNALPHFPQLKLEPGDQPWITHAPSIPFATIYILGSIPAAKSVTSRPLASTQGVLSILSRTIAARLFDRRLQEEHLEFCAALARSVEIRSLSYPFTPEALPDIREAILQDFSVKNKHVFGQ